jgi:hypothetical protein
MSINTKVERSQPNRYRTDFDIEFSNGYKLIIEINEKIHEKIKKLISHDYVQLSIMIQK